MRQIKFRAWSREQKKLFVIDNKFHITDGQTVYKLDPHNKETRYFPMPLANPVIMQYTGLKDRSGKEIYEWDIVERDGILGVIEWNAQQGAWWIVGIINKNTDIVTSFTFTEKLGNGYYSRKDLEVVGDTYNNPELL